MKKNYDELEKNLPFKTTRGSMYHIRCNILKLLPKERYILALKRLRIIVESESCSGYDCTVTGMKSTECSWGLCQENKKLWPEPQDYTWPHEEDRIAPLHRGDDYMCPLETKHKGPGWKGCFYRCAYFSKKKKMPTREQALQRIDELIKEAGG